MPAPGHLPALPGTDQVDDRDRLGDVEDDPGTSKSQASSKSHTRKRSGQVHCKEKPYSKVHTRERIKKHGSVKDASAEADHAFV